MAILPLVYIALVVWMRNAFDRIDPPLPSSEAPKTPMKLGVVIPFRNEEESLPTFLEYLQEAIKHGPLNVEFVFVDDHSSDFSSKMLQTSTLKQTTLLNAGQGKKAALATGMEHLATEYILTLDADVHLQKNYFFALSSLLEEYGNKTDLFILPVRPVGDDSFRSAFQQLDFLSLMGTTAAFASKENPILCNGANLLFLRSAWLEAQSELHPELASGDDVFLLQSMKKRNGSIRWVHDHDLAVDTEVCPTWKSFLQQRIRWGSKAKSYSDRSLQMLSWLVFLSQFSLVAMFLNAPLASTRFKMLTFVTWGLYVLSTHLFLSTVSQWYRIDLRKHLFLSILFYPFYLVYTAFAALFLPVRWKGRVSK